MAEGGGRTWRSRTWRTWQLALVAVVALVVGIAAGAGTKPKSATVSAGHTATTLAIVVSTFAPVTAPPRTVPPTVPTAAPTTLAPAPTTTAAAVDIVTFTGSSTKTTDTFAVRNPWRIRWTVTGGAGVGIEVLDQGGSRLDYISTDPGTDESVIRRACTCYLKLTPFGSSYTVKVNGTPA